MAQVPKLCPVQLKESQLAFVVDNMPNAEIGTSSIHSNGLFAIHDLAVGDVLGELDGQCVDWQSHEHMRKIAPYGGAGTDLFMEWNALSPSTLLVRPLRTKYSFINHNREPNLVLQNDPMRVVVARAVDAGEELTLDYRCEPLSMEYLQNANFL